MFGLGGLFGSVAGGLASSTTSGADVGPIDTEQNNDFTVTGGGGSNVRDAAAPQVSPLVLAAAGVVAVVLVAAILKR